jgi:hypothetical protein
LSSDHAVRSRNPSCGGFRHCWSTRTVTSTGLIAGSICEIRDCEIWDYSDAGGLSSPRSGKSVETREASKKILPRGVVIDRGDWTQTAGYRPGGSTCLAAEAQRFPCCDGRLGLGSPPESQLS